MANIKSQFNFSPFSSSSTTTARVYVCLSVLPATNNSDRLIIIWLLLHNNNNILLLLIAPHLHPCRTGRRTRLLVVYRVILQCPVHAGPTHRRQLPWLHGRLQRRLASTG